MIGVVTTSYPRVLGDGAGNFVRRRVDALLATGDTVEVIAAGMGDGHGIDGLDPRVFRVAAPTLFYGGGAPDRLEAGGAGVWGEALGFSLRQLRMVHARAGAWRSVESHWLLPCGLLARAALPHLPHRANVHGGDLHLLSRLPLGRSLARAMCTPRTTLVFASQGLRQLFETLVDGPVDGRVAGVRVEAAPIDTILFQLAPPSEKGRARMRLGIRGRLVLSAGRLVPIKGMDVLVRAVGALPEAARPSLMVAGEGPERGSLARIAERLGVDLRLPGHIPATELSEWMAAADVYVQPSRVLPGGRGEGMPLAAREAISRGLPLIATASGGLVELQGLPGVTLIAPDDSASLGGALAAMLAKVA